MKNKDFFKQLAFIFAACALFFTLTWHGFFTGYEKETADAARALLVGHYEVKRAGLCAVLMYVPFWMAILLFHIPKAETLITWVPIFYSAIAVSVYYAIAFFLTLSKKKAALFALVIAAATSVWPYTNAGMEYQLLLGIGLITLATLRFKQNKNGVWLVGAAAAFTTLTKSYGILFVLPALVVLVQDTESTRRKKMIDVVKICATVCGAFLLQVILNLHFFGRVSGAYIVANEFQIVHWWEGFYGLFFSFGKGLFLYDPLLLLTIFYWRTFWEKYKTMSMVILMNVALILCVNAPFIYWTDETWGPRKLLPLIPLLHLPLLIVFDELYKRRAWMIKIVFAVVLCISVYVQLLGSTFTYGKYLAILRTGNLDSLTTMRYIPELSQVVIFNSLLWSNFDQSRSIAFQEASWFRWVSGDSDVVFHSVHLELTQYQKPDIIWFRKN